MIIDEIKKANIEALKSKNTIARSILGIVINKYMQIEIESRTTNQIVGDAELFKILQKTIKELEEEKSNYLKVKNDAEALNIEKQKQIIEKYLPTMLSDEKIKTVILSLEDKSIPFVMRFFKANYNGLVDMKNVLSILNKIN